MARAGTLHLVTEMQQGMGQSTGCFLSEGLQKVRNVSKDDEVGLLQDMREDLVEPLLHRHVRAVYSSRRNKIGSLMP